ncbi:MAG: cytochrome c oxidase assembly protein [Gammaproteobacteria bacterium]|nr:cytochrome c oxidase assembly protein [Gammaproteobacteria bacterium]
MSGNPRASTHGRLVALLLLTVVGMFGFGFALVPLYDVFCEVTGFGGRTSGTPARDVETTVDTDRLVAVELVANVNDGLAWDFRPATARIRVHPGQAYTTSFFAKNNAGRAVVGQAVPSVTPGEAAAHFKKTECFCFTQQRFEPGEARDMPLRFVVDPALDEKIEVLTLSYTFFEAKTARADPAAAGF